MDVLTVLRLVFGSTLILFVPGLSWSYLLVRQQEVAVAGRVAISFGLSLVLVPLVIFWMNLTLGVAVTLLNVVLATLVLSAVPPVYVGVRVYMATRETKGL